ncbi:MAG: signal peptidase I [Bacilli bacterium]|jgi:signal peptidase
MEEVIAKQKPIKKKKSILGKIFTIVVGAFVGLLLIMQITGAITAQSNYGVQRFGDYQILVVLTDSMEPSLKVGEGIVVKKTPLNEIKASTTIEAQDGDILTFFRTDDNVIVTHRVIEILPQGDGTFDFKTLGDNLNAQTCPVGGCDPVLNADYVEGQYVLGKVVGQSVAFGQFFRIVANPIAIAVVAVVPLLYVFISSVFDVIKQSKMKDEAVTDEDIDEFEVIKQQEKLRLLIEMEKERLRQERVDKTPDETVDKEAQKDGK